MAQATNNQPNIQPSPQPAVETLPPAVPPEPPGRLGRYKRPLQALAVIILIAIVALAAWQARQQNNPGQPSANLQTVSACAQGHHQAISFLKPASLASRYVGDSESRYSQVSTTHNTTYSTVFLSAACIPAQDTADLQTLDLPPPTAANVKTFGQGLADPTKVAYSKDTIAFVTFVLQRIVASDYSLTSGQAQPFTNPNIKSGAWRMNFSYDRKAGTPAYLPAKKQGTVLLMAGSDTWYYFMLAATQDQWQSGGQVWPQILNSIKVDQ